MARNANLSKTALAAATISSVIGEAGGASLGAPEERTHPLTETRIFIEELERLPLQLIPPVYPTGNRIC
jgi:hypothetical protein